MEVPLLLFSLLLVTASCIIIWRSSHGFELASDFLGRKLPPGIKGATLNAIASSMPEFLTTVFFLFWLKDADGFSGGLGVSSGSALFNLLLIPALAVLMLFSMGKGKGIVLNKRVLLREGLVLLLSQVLFIGFLFSGELREQEGLYLVLLYAGYLLLLYVITRRKGTSDPGFTMPEPGPARSWLKRVILLDVSGLVMGKKKMTPLRAWVLLGISTAVMTAGTWLLVLGTDQIGEVTGVPLIFVAVVLSAAATSVPDTIISMKDARKGNYDDAVSNALGSNIFDIAFALGLPVLLYNLVYRESIVLPGEILDFTQEVWVFLLLSTVLALVIMVSGKYFTRLKAWILLGMYALFIIFVGTQVVEEGMLHQVGDHLQVFLTRVADWIGSQL
jgi:cation:H+ antiporter